MDFTVIAILIVVCLLIGFLFGRMYEKSDTDSQKESQSSKGIHIHVDDRTGKTVVTKRDKTYHNTSAMSQSLQDELMGYLVDIQRWFTSKRETESSESAPQPSLPESPLTIQESEPPKSGDSVFVKSVARLLQGETKIPEEIPSIAAQIDHILQLKLEEANLHKRGIRLMELPNRGMVFMIGLEQYEFIDEIPDPEVQDIIRQAVAEWEEKGGI